MNKIFVIEGTDGSGKQTQTELIYNRLNQLKKDVIKFSFPNYNSDSSGPIREYLSGNISLDANDVSPKAASTFYAVDRYISFKENIEKYYNDTKTIILFDRYISSNLLHQGGKLLNKENNNDYLKLDEFSNWLINFECNDLNLPIPTKVIFLHLPVEYTISMMKERDNKFSKDKKKDIHETDINHLINAEKAGLYYAKKYDWKIIECIKDGMVRTIEDINDEILSVIIKYVHE